MENMCMVEQFYIYSSGGCKSVRHSFYNIRHENIITFSFKKMKKKKKLSCKFHKSHSQSSRSKLLSVRIYDVCERICRSHMNFICIILYIMTP